VAAAALALVAMYLFVPAPAKALMVVASALCPALRDQFLLDLHLRLAPARAERSRSAVALHRLAQGRCACRLVLPVPAKVVWSALKLVLVNPLVDLPQLCPQ
jgi:hypothetical protein